MSDVNHFSQESYPECLLDLPPILRTCEFCYRLIECEHGTELVLGNHSITDKVLSARAKVLNYDWMPLPEQLKTYTLEELNEFNAAVDLKEQRRTIRARNEG